MPESGRADMKFLRILICGARTCPGAVRDPADTLFCAAEPCIPGMTPSVRHPPARRWIDVAKDQGRGHGPPGMRHSTGTSGKRPLNKGAIWQSRDLRAPLTARAFDCAPLTVRLGLRYRLLVALERLARHSRNSRYSGSRGCCGATSAAGAGAGAAPDAADTAAPGGMLRSSQSCDALKRVQPATVALGASSFHLGWNGGRCSCATLSNIVSTSSDRRR